MEEIGVLNFNVKGQVFPINFPTIGQYRQIEVLKQQLSGGRYYEMFNSNLISSQETLDIIDIESYFSILCPDLVKSIDKKAGSFGELGMTDFNELKNEYTAQFVPWWNTILALIRKK